MNFNTDEQHNFADSILAAAQQPQVIKDLQGGHAHPVVILPPGFTKHELDLEKLMPNPPRKKGTATLNTCDSFVQFVTREGSLASTCVYCEADYAAGRIQFIAVMNDNDDQPQWRDYRALFSPVFSEEWKRWTGKNKHPMSQVEFAQFIEDNQKDIVSAEGRPSGADMLEMAINLEAKQDVTFKSFIRLQSGTTQLEYRDKEDDETVKRMAVFDMFDIGIPVLFGGQAYRMEARLRYRINSGQIKFWYELVRPDVTLESATKDEIEKVKAAGFPVFFGKPAA